MQRYNFTNRLFLFKIESMIRRFFIILCFISLTTCDDGDIIAVQLEFDQELERCDNFEDSYLIYDTREDPNEALLLVLPKPQSDFLFTDATETPIELTIPSEAQFNYRTYNRTIDSDALCNVLGDPNLMVLEDNEATAGTVQVTVTIIDDDNDGIPSEDEYGPGGIDDPQDSDEDGIPDYLDEDDDNDNVKTEDEDDNDDDDNPFTNPLDTDGDNIPNYLDDDDDGDGIDTRLEDQNSNKNPRNPDDQVDDENDIPIYRYLYNHPTAMEAFPDSGFISNTYTRSVFTTFLILNTGIGPVSATEIPFGTYESPSINITEGED